MIIIICMVPVFFFFFQRKTLGHLGKKTENPWLFLLQFLHSSVLDTWYLTTYDRIKYINLILLPFCCKLCFTSRLLVQGNRMYFGKIYSTVVCLCSNLVPRVFHLATPLSPWKQGCKFQECIFIWPIMSVGFASLLSPAFNKE